MRLPCYGDRSVRPSVRPPADRPSAEPSGSLRTDVPAAGGAEPTPRLLSLAHLPEMRRLGPTSAGCALKRPAALATAVLDAPSILLSTPKPSSRTAAREGSTEALPRGSSPPALPAPGASQQTGEPVSVRRGSLEAGGRKESSLSTRR